MKYGWVPFDPEMDAALATDDFMRRNPKLILADEPLYTLTDVDGEPWPSPIPGRHPAHAANEGRA